MYKLSFVFCLLFMNMVAIADNTLVQTPDNQLQNFTQYHFPNGCEPMDYEYLGDHLYLKGKEDDRSRLYFLYNQSSFAILVNHDLKKDPGAQAGWASTIDPGHWAGIMVPAQDKRFQIICQVVVPGQRNLLANCSKAIKVCRYPNYQVSEAQMAQGGYWLFENKLLPDALTYAAQRGVTLGTANK